MSKIFYVVAMATRPMMQSKFCSVLFVTPNLLIILIKFHEILTYILGGEVVLKRPTTHDAGHSTVTKAHLAITWQVS